MINERFARSTENLFNFRFRSRAEVFRRPADGGTFAEKLLMRFESKP